MAAAHAIPAEVRLYDRLFADETPDGHKDREFMEFINPDSLKVITAFLEPGLKGARAEQRFQFQRLGYFCVDKDSTEVQLVFNRTVTLRDTWAKIQQKG